MESTMYYYSYSDNGTAYCWQKKQEEEQWLPVVGWEESYRVSNFGRVYSIKRNIFMKGGTSKMGYKYINLPMLGYGKYDRKYYAIHRMVAEAFLYNHGNKPHINHIDGNPSNNRLENLEWCTHAENMKHSYEFNQIDLKGENQNTAKLTNADVIMVFTSSLPSKELAAALSVSRDCINDIRRGKSWVHITAHLESPPRMCAGCGKDISNRSKKALFCNIGCRKKPPTTIS